MEPISFFVPGNPKTLKRHRDVKTKSGIRLRYDPSKGDKMDFLAKAMLHRPAEPTRAALCMELICVFPRPKNHYRTGRHSGTLKDSAPFWHISTPDADNILKFVGDALNGIFWHDDRQVMPMGVWKVYGSPPGVLVRLFEPDANDIEFVSDGLEGACHERLS